MRAHLRLPGHLAAGHDPRPARCRAWRQGSLLGTIRVGRTTQVTYAGHPLYTYVADTNPGQTSYVGVSQFGGKWFGIRA